MLHVPDPPSMCFQSSKRTSYKKMPCVRGGKRPPGTAPAGGVLEGPVPHAQGWSPSRHRAVIV